MWKHGIVKKLWRRMRESDKGIPYKAYKAYKDGIIRVVFLKISSEGVVIYKRVIGLVYGKGTILE